MNDIYDAIIYGIDYIKRCKGDNNMKDLIMSSHPFDDIADAYHKMIVDSCRLVVDNENGLRLVANKNGSCIDFDINKYHNILPKIKKVIFNPPATVVFWEDNIKTVVKCQNDEIFDPEKGLAMAISKRALGNKGNYYNIFKNHTTDVTFQNNFIIVSNPISKLSDNIRDGLSKLADKLYKSNNYILENKYGDRYDSRFYFAGKRHKIVCAGDCYHVRNIKKENSVVYSSLEDALNDGCTPCKHCHGVHKNH